MPEIELINNKKSLVEDTTDTITMKCISTKYKPIPELFWLLNGQVLDSKYLDYKQNDYHLNGLASLELKYPLLNGGNGGFRNNHLSFHQHQRRQHHSNGGKHNNNNGNGNGGNSQSKMANTIIDSYHFECVQVLSNVISVSSEVVQLYGTAISNHDSEQSYHGNSVEAGNVFFSYLNGQLFFF